MIIEDSMIFFSPKSKDDEEVTPSTKSSNQDEHEDAVDDTPTSNAPLENGTAITKSTSCKSSKSIAKGIVTNGQVSNEKIPKRLFPPVDDQTKNPLMIEMDRGDAIINANGSEQKATQNESIDLVTPATKPQKRRGSWIPFYGLVEYIWTTGKKKPRPEEENSMEPPAKRTKFDTPQKPKPPPKPVKPLTEEEIAAAKAKAEAEAIAKAKAEALARYLAEHDLKPFHPIGKKNLEIGELSKLVGSLLDRQEPLKQFYKALTKMARHVGSESLDAKDVPLIAVAGNSGSGKTEFLKWIFNHCCSFQDPEHMDAADSAIAKTLVRGLNQVLPEGQKPLDNILVLYASYSGDSEYTKNEAPIVGTTVERLLRSFHGNTTFLDNYPPEKRVRYKGLKSGQDIVDLFQKHHGNTGFVLLLDDIMSIHYENEEECQELIDSMLQFSQKCLQSGTFCAVVGTTDSICDLCDVTVSKIGKSVEPIFFPNRMPQMEAKARELSNDGESHNESHGMSFDVTMKVLQSLSNARDWEEYLCDPDVRSRIEPLERRFRIPNGLSADYVFELISRTVLGEVVDENELCRKHIVIADRLGGHLVLMTDDNHQITQWDRPRGTLTIPGWRLFQIPPTFNTQVFSHIKNWVLVESRKLFYEYGPDERTKTLETSTLALLELRRAMHNVVYGSPPSLEEWYKGLRIHHNLSPSILQTKACNSPAGFQSFAVLPYEWEVVSSPTVYLSNRPNNEKGVEGVLRECLDGKTIFFQTKPNSAGGPEEICDWLVHAHKRARELGYQRDEYIVQLFIPGEVSAEETDDDEATLRQRWPANSMVFADHALTDIFKPYISLNLY